MESDRNLKRKSEPGDSTAAANTSAKSSKPEIDEQCFKANLTQDSTNPFKNRHSDEQAFISYPMISHTEDFFAQNLVYFLSEPGRCLVRCQFNNIETSCVDDLLKALTTQQDFNTEFTSTVLDSIECKSMLKMDIGESSNTLKFTFTGECQLGGILELQCQCDQIKIETSSRKFITPSFDIEFPKNFDSAKYLFDRLRYIAKPIFISYNTQQEEGFNIPYVGRHVYQDVQSYIEQIASLWRNTCIQFYAPVATILQSSGHGKTRLLYEFGKEHLTIFLCLRQHGSGFPFRSFLATDFDMAVSGTQNYANTFFLALIVSILIELACLQQANPEIIEELQKDVYNNSMMRRYVNLKLAKIRAAKREGKNVIIRHVDSPDTIDMIISTYLKERNDSQKEEIEKKVRESLTRLNELLFQLPLPSDIQDLESLSSQLQKLDETQVKKYAHCLSIFQPWTLCDSQTSTVADQDQEISCSLIHSYRYETAREKVRDLIQKINQPIYIVLDESAYLFTKKNIRLDKPCSQVLSQALRDLFIAIPVVCITTSTGQSLAEFALRNEKVTASSRQVVVKRNYPLPYSRFLFLDYFVDSDYQKQLIEFAEQGKLNNSASERSDDQTLYSFIKRRNPKNTLFYYGRPVWYSRRNDYSIISYAERKLIFKAAWSMINPNDLDFACVAVMAARTTFLLNCVVMPASFSHNLVFKFMATLFHINKQMTVMSYNYPSEPILAEAAARLMSKTAILKTILDKINDQIFNSTLMVIGGLDEFVVQLVCLRAKDAAVVNPNSKLASIENRFSICMTVEEYLIALLGQEFVQDFRKNDSNATAMLKKRSEFLKGLVCFNHFVKKCDDLNVKGLVHDFVGRCAAGLFINSFPQFDLFIPVILENGRFTFILISIKNVSDESQTQLANFLSYDDVFSHSATDIRIHKDDYCMMLIFDLSDPDANVIQHCAQNEAFLISGLRPYPSLDKESREKLLKLLDFSRFKRERFNMIAQKRAFPAMYENEREQGGDLDLQDIRIETMSVDE